VLDLADVGMAEAAEDVQGQLPCGPGLGYRAGCLMGVAEVGQDLRFAGTVTDFPDESEGLLVAADGVGLAAQVMLDIADAVPDGGLTVMLAEFLVESQGLPAERAGLAVVAQHGQAESDIVQGHGLSGLMAGFLVQAQRVPGVLNRGGVLFLALSYPAQALVGPGFAGAVAELLVQPQGAGVAGTGRAVIAGPVEGLPLEQVRYGLCGWVAEALRGGYRNTLDGGLLPRMALHIKEHPHCPGKLPRVDIEPVVIGQGHRREEAVMVGGEPGVRLLPVSEVLGRGPRRRREGDRDIP
jgi:hypothetical protein